MKVTLEVASGVHQGKQIPITGPQFLIGRDPQCQLRPASQAISKQHCAVVIRDGKVYVKDFGSTNGTLVNDEVVRGEVRVLADGDSLKIGPLDFVVRVDQPAAKQDGTPLPDRSPETAAALAAVKAAGAGGTAKNATPAPKKPAGSKEAPAVQTGSKESPALTPGSKDFPAVDTGSRESPALVPQSPGDDQDKIAAILLGLGGDDDVPGGSTVTELPAVDAQGNPTGDTKADEKKDPKKATPTREDTSNAASEILRKYMRRPK